MKKIVLLSGFALMALFTSTASQAADAWHTDLVKRVYPLADGSFSISFMSDSAECTGTSPKYHHVKVGVNAVTQESLLMMYSAALTAGAAGKKLTINYSTDTNECVINRLAINY